MPRVDLENRIWSTSSVPGSGSTANQTATGRTPAGAAGFGQILQDQLSAQAAKAGVKFSAHAQTRLASRQISLSSDDITKLGDAITRAAAKGSRESLVMMNQAALVVSVPNRTVITAVDKGSLKENIFTNIDSAVIL
jgi:flagellar operon protein